MRNNLGLLVALFSSALSAQSYVIDGGMVYTLGSKGTLASASVWIENGKIKAVGEKLDAPSTVKRIGAKGKIVTPGFFDAYSQLGLMEIPSIPSTNDSSASSPELSAGFRVTDAFNPYSTVIPVTRVEGITRVLCVPNQGSNLFLGTGSVMQLGSTDKYVVVSKAAMVMNMGERGSSLSSGSRATAISNLREILSDARDYRTHVADYEQNKKRKYMVSKRDLEALVPVVQGTLPIVVRVHRVADMRAIMNLKSEFPSVRWIFYGASQGWIIAKEIADAKIPVIVEPLVNNPYQFERLNATMENAGLLHKAGVLLTYTYADEPHNSRALRYALGNAVANGLPWLEAIKGVTVNAAKTFNVANYGTLEAGKDADVVIWSGDPLEVTTVAEQVWIQGKEIPMRTRQTLLRDRYKNLAPDLSHAYQTNGL